jgi:hypothetical protein
MPKHTQRCHSMGISRYPISTDTPGGDHTLVWEGCMIRQKARQHLENSRNPWQSNGTMRSGNYVRLPDKPGASNGISVACSRNSRVSWKLITEHCLASCVSSPPWSPIMTWHRDGKRQETRCWRYTSNARRIACGCSTQVCSKPASCLLLRIVCYCAFLLW